MYVQKRDENTKTKKKRLEIKKTHPKLKGYLGGSMHDDHDDAHTKHSSHSPKSKLKEMNKSKY